MKIGDYIEVKKGEKDPDDNKSDIGTWRGLVTEVQPKKAKEELIVEIAWDVDTLKKMPAASIKMSIANGYSFSEMNLGVSSLIVLEEFIGTRMEGREELIAELEDQYDDDNFDEGDEDDQRLAEILGTTNIAVTLKNLLTYKAFLIKHLKMPVYLTGIEDFSWEEKFMFGYGSEEEYEELKKTNPSYTDTFQLVKIFKADTFADDLIVKVKRTTDRKSFDLRLSDLESTDEKSSNYAILNDFSVWVVNY